uniref:Uncharacterized protein n=1 Tax=Gossypium raimondii TaxID=29730 RepID=A0A0D2NQD0_GOSRA|nr:hypothetical protein B456_006G112600 [Gossypium raimondii]
MATRMSVRYVSRRFSSGSGKILSEEEKAAENIYIQLYCCRKLSERNWRNLHARDPSQRRNRMLVQGVLRPMVALPLHREHLLRKYQPISTETTGFSLVLQPLVLLWDGISTLKTRSKRPEMGVNAIGFSRWNMA